jgi:two-component system sensor histidine kinase/response regulator
LLKDLYLLSDNAFNLLENLMNWAKSQSGGIICRPVRENIPALIKSILALFTMQADSKNIKLEFPEHKEIFGYFDPELISVVIRNLISNALKFTPHGGKVTLSAYATMDKNSKETACIAVTDTGTGMSPEIIYNLLNKSIHFTTYGTDNEKGSGLGFQLCKEFVAMNKGHISIESTTGAGSTFLISLPVD